ncbi:MAG: serine hydrolase [Saprospiraceae bacterium]|nr:serine hydrolase [Saprospiraceae bacterium]
MVKNLLIALLAAFAPFLSIAQNTLYFPPKTGTAWAATPPSELGFCPERIDSLYQFLESRNTKSFILLKDGKIVLEKYFGTYVQDSIWYWASAGKSLTAFLVGQAQEEGLFQIDDATSDYLGAGWTSCTPTQEAAITIRHQLAMTTGLDDTPTTNDPDPNNCTDPSCLQYLAPPGTRWAYHTGAYRLLQDVIAASSGLTINQFTKTRLLDRTGMKGLWIGDVMYGRARDMARFGLLVQAHGVWDGDTLLHDQDYFNAMVTPSQDLNQSYGYLWWLNGQPSLMLPGVQFVFPGPLFGNAPPDLIAALGKNDQKIHVVPSKGWVVVRQGNSAGYTGIGGNLVPIGFDNDLWAYLNLLDCNASSTQYAHEAAPAIQVTPNPSSEGIWNIRAVERMDAVEVYDARGQRVFVAQPDADGLRIDGSAWPPGVYFARCLVQGKFSAPMALVRY